MSAKQQLQWLRLLTHGGALIPLAMMGWDFYANQLGPEPIRELTLRTGTAALILLFLSLTCTPLATLTGWKVVLPLRKPLGLYSFLYVCLHLLIFTISYGYVSGLFQWQYVWEEALFRRYALVGLLSFLILLPLAATSTKFAMRKMGKRWKQLHRLVYVAAVLAVIHFFWLIKLATYDEPLIYAVLLAILFALRLPPVRQRLVAWRTGKQG